MGPYKIYCKLGVAMHACNTDTNQVPKHLVRLGVSTWRLREENYHTFQDNLGYTATSTHQSKLHGNTLSPKNQKTKISPQSIYYQTGPVGLRISHWSP